MATKKQTSYVTVEGELYYARLHEDNMDKGDYHEKTNGQFNVVFVPADNDQMQALIDAGFPEVSMGNQMIKPLKAANDRPSVKLKRPNVHPSGIEDFGGAPVVNKGKTNTPWDFIADGEIGNGTKAAVKLCIYGSGSTASVRLERVGILEHVPYEEGATASNDGW